MSRTELAAFGLHLDWAHVSGRLTAEAPASLRHLHVFGDCAVGARTYTDVRWAIHDCDIGRFCSIGADVLIGPGEHPMDFMTTHPVGFDPLGRVSALSADNLYGRFATTGASRPMPEAARTRIGPDVWVGAKAVVKRGVQVGAGAVIGCGAVVTRDVAPYAVVAGCPARVISHRFDEAMVERLLASQWWLRDLSALPRRDFADIEGFLSELRERDPALARYQVRQVAEL